MKVKKSKYYEVNILRGTIGKDFKRASEVQTSHNVRAVRGSDIILCTAFQYFVAGEVR